MKLSDGYEAGDPRGRPARAERAHAVADAADTDCNNYKHTVKSFTEWTFYHSFANIYAGMMPAFKL
jgi:hypothetical protein